MTRILTLAAVLLLAALPAAAGETTVGGFVDASWFTELDTDTNGFGLDQVEIDVTHCFCGAGLLRADLEWVKDGEGWAQDLEQGYLALSPDFLAGVTLTLGKFNAPIGFELLDAPDMYQYSHALVFDHGLPTNLTGVMAARPLGEYFDLAAYWVNGWDMNEADCDGPRTFGGRLGFSLGELGGLGASMITGENWDEAGTADPADDFELKRTVMDLDLTLTPHEGWTFGAEYNMGTVEVDDTETEWAGMLVMGHYDFTEMLGLTARFDWFDDSDGAVFGMGEDTRTAFAIAPTLALGEGLGMLLEIRRDMSENEIWVDSDGAAIDAVTTAALEITGSF